MGSAFEVETKGALEVTIELHLYLLVCTWWYTCYCTRVQKMIQLKVKLERRLYVALKRTPKISL